MQAFKYITVLLIVISTFSCKHLQRAQETKVVRDSVFVERIVSYTDTVFKTAPSSVSTSLYVPCPDFAKNFKPVVNQYKNAQLAAKMYGNILELTCKCDTLAIEAKLKNTIEKNNRVTSTTITKPPVFVRYIPGWVKFFAWVGFVALLLVIAAVVVTLQKLFKQTFL